MRQDIYGQIILNEQDLCDLFYTNPNIDLKRTFIEDDIKFNEDLELNNIPKLIKYHTSDVSINEFDNTNQSNFKMPIEYKELDIAQYVLELCKTQDELQRAGQELLLFQDRNMFDLLRYLKYLVDTMRKHNVVWGVGRGSSVASFVLFLIGIHRINSLYYDLSIDEFLK